MTTASSSSSRYTKETTNFARLSMCIIGPCTRMIRDVLSLNVQPCHLQSLVIKAKLKLNFEQNKQLTTGTIPNYSNFDLTFLYLLLRTPGICNPSIASPTRGWGKPPVSSTQVTLGDDIERIRLMKNGICSHIKDPKIKKSEFDDKLSELKDIASRIDTLLAPASDYVSELNNMEIETLEHEVEDYYVDQIREIVKQHEEKNKRVDALEEKMEIVEKSCKARKRKFEQDIERNTGQISDLKTRTATLEYDIYLQRAEYDIQKAQDEAFLIVIQKERKYFIETRAFKNSLLAIQKHKIISVIGTTGQGKTSIANQIAIYFSEIGYRILSIKSVEELRSKLDPRKKTLFLIDDTFGKHHKIQRDVDSWVQISEDIVKWSENFDIYGIFSCQKLVWNECKAYLHGISIFQCVVDLTSEENSLRMNEKENILRTHLIRAKRNMLEMQVNDIVTVKTAIGFPYCCKSFSTNDELFKLGEEYFRTPMDSLKNEFERLFRMDKEKFCILLLVLVLGENCPKNFHQRMNQDILDKVRDILKPFGLEPESNAIALENALEDLKGCYIHDAGCGLSLMHDMYIDALCLIQGNRNPNLILRFCSARFFHQYISIDTENAQNGKNSLIVLNPSNEHLLHCVLRLLEKDDMYLVFDSPIIHNANFIQMLSSYISAQPTSCSFLVSGTRNTKTVLGYCFECNEDEMVKLALQAIEVLRNMPIPQVSLKHCIDDCLCIASRCGNSGAVDTLIRFGANVSFKSSNGLSPLIWAINCGDIATLAILIRHGADVNFIDTKRQSALHFAVNRMSYRFTHLILLLLIISGADTELKDARDFTALDLIKERLNKEEPESQSKESLNFQSRILENPLGTVRTSEPETLFSCLTRATSERFFEFLLDQALTSKLGFETMEKILKLNKDFKYFSYNGEKPLQYFLKKNTNANTLKSHYLTLFVSQEDINTMDSFGKTVLHHVAEYGDFFRLDTLLSYNPNIDVMDHSGKKAIYYALRKLNSTDVDCFLERDGMFEDKDPLGRTIMHWVVKKSDRSSLILLLKHGVKIGIKDTMGKTEFEYATENRDSLSLYLLFSHWRNIDPVDFSPYNVHYEMLQEDFINISSYLQEFDPIFSDLAEWMRSEIYIMCYFSFLNNVYLRDSNNKTTFHYAAEKRDLPTLALLVIMGGKCKLDYFHTYLSTNQMKILEGIPLPGHFFYFL